MSFPLLPAVIVAVAVSAFGGVALANYLAPSQIVVRRVIATASPTPPPPAQVPVPGSPAPAPSSSFSFTVINTECGIHSLSGTSGVPTASPAQGQYCVILFNEVNNASSPQTCFPTAEFNLATGTTYKNSSQDSDALVGAVETYLPNGMSADFELNPGQKVENVLVFDLPPSITAPDIMSTVKIQC